MFFSHDLQPGSPARPLQGKETSHTMLGAVLTLKRNLRRFWGWHLFRMMGEYLVYNCVHVIELWLTGISGYKGEDVGKPSYFFPSFLEGCSGQASFIHSCLVSRLRYIVALPVIILYCDVPLFPLDSYFFGVYCICYWW